MVGIKRRVLMHNPRLFLSRVGFFSKSGLLPWYTTNPPDLSQSFWGRAHKGDFTSVTVRKHPSRQKYQKKQRHFRSLEDSWQERLADVVTPLWRLSYEEQLKVKFEAQKKIIQRLESSLRVLEGVSGRVAAPHSEGLRCHLHPIIPSPIVNGYRNKSTFSVNWGPDGNPKTVGYYLGTWRDGNIVCVPCSQLKNIPEKHSQVAQTGFLLKLDLLSFWQDWMPASPETLLVFPAIPHCWDYRFLRNHTEIHLAALIYTVTNMFEVLASLTAFAVGAFADNHLMGYYEVFLRQSSVEPCLLFHEGGHWRELTVRTNSQGHTMAIITFHPQGLSQEELCVQKVTLRDFFTKGPGAVCELTSLYFQESTMTRCSHEQSPYQLLFGEPHIFEDLLGLKIRISPDAFFQINTAGAELLYQTIGELSGVDSNTILLDICCGTGVIGLSLAQRASQVLGIELVEQAVEDARWTAAFNGVSNCEFHAGRAEKILPQLLKSQKDEKLTVAVVNPARAGLHYQVVQAIRNCRAIHRLVFVSCKPHGESTRNFIELCCPPNSAKKLLGEPFVLRQAVPVDLFPHTPHCELVLLFTRYD